MRATSETRNSLAGDFGFDRVAPGRPQAGSYRSRSGKAEDTPLVGDEPFHLRGLLDLGALFVVLADPRGLEPV